MPSACDTCPQHAKGCEPQDYSELVGTLEALSNSELPGAKLMSTVLMTLTSSLLFAEGCMVRAHQAVFPLMCTAQGLLAVMAIALDQRQHKSAFEPYLRELFGGNTDDRTR